MSWRKAHAMVSHFPRLGASRITQPLGFFRRLWLGENGATIVEYVLLLMFVAMACFAAVATFGNSLHRPFQQAVNDLS